MRPVLFSIAVLFQAPARADGPVLASLQNAAAVAPLSATIEIQSSNAGAPFAGNRGDGAVNAATGTSPAQRLSGGPGLSRPSSKDAPPAPALSDKEARNLKLIRGVGLGAAAAGIGLFAYALAVGATGPIGWAAALVFFGGMAAYLAHRRLNGKDDFR